MTLKRRPQLLAHLAAPTQAWCKLVVEDYELEGRHLRLLQLAGEAWHRCCQARETLVAEGLTFSDRFGASHARPEVAIERDSRLAFGWLIRELDLDVEPPAKRSRPRAEATFDTIYRERGLNG